jgi:uncharacterized protein YdeI (YjbR/CyaY-like superfamily)
VDLELDTSRRELDVPADLAAVMDSQCRTLFDNLSYSRKQHLVPPINEAKRAETR